LALKKSITNLLILRGLELPSENLPGHMPLSRPRCNECSSSASVPSDKRGKGKSTFPKDILEGKSMFLSKDIRLLAIELVNDTLLHCPSLSS
jgi:hypothetical protein